MDLKVLSNFLAVAREESFSKAAAAIHISQPTLSRQIAELEEEFGKKLFVRGTKALSLTAEGQLLKKRAQEMLSLADKTEAELRGDLNEISGNIYIGAGETYGIHTITRAFRNLQIKYPDLCLHFSSGDGRDLDYQLNNGLIDMAVTFGDVDHSRFECIELPFRDRLGVYLRKNDPLAVKNQISPEKDLIDKPIIINRESSGDLIPGISLHRFKVTGTYNLLYNASLMAEDGLGYVVGFEHIIHTEGTELVFIPFVPEYKISMHLIYRKYQIMPRHVMMLIEEIRKMAE